MKWRRCSAVPPHGSVLSQSNISGNNHSLNFSNMVAFHHGPVHFQIKFTAAPVLVVCLLLSCLACPIKKSIIKFQSKISLSFANSHFQNLIVIPIMINLKILSFIYRDVFFSWKTELKATESKLIFRIMFFGIQSLIFSISIIFPPEKYIYTYL